jgi:hypothetical protein
MFKRCTGLAMLCMLGCSNTHAEDPSYKFTTGVYVLSDGGLSNSHGLDINVRQTSQLGNIWGAWYRSPEQQVSQPRMGWDKSFEASHWRIMPSVQTASGGFWGGSLSVETGDTLFAGLGLGRTNLHPYVNLNFDPNDAWMASVGYRWSSLQSLSVQVVRDNRQNPDQQHLHLLYRTPMPDGHRLTLDVLFKSGLVEDRMVQRTGMSLTYDFAQFFTRIAYDPAANFTPQNMWRLSIGRRY